MDYKWIVCLYLYAFVCFGSGVVSNLSLSVQIGHLSHISPRQLVLAYPLKIFALCIFCACLMSRLIACRLHVLDWISILCAFVCVRVCVCVRQRVCVLTGLSFLQWIPVCTPHLLNSTTNVLSADITKAIQDDVRYNPKSGCATGLGEFVKAFAKKSAPDCIAGRSRGAECSARLFYIQTCHCEERVCVRVKG